MHTALRQQTLKNKLALDTQLSKVLVVGLGVTGMSVARFLQENDYQFAIVDSRDKPPFIDELNTQLPGTAVFTGGFDATAFHVASHMLVSPGVSLEETVIKQALVDGVRLISDIDLFACATQQMVVAISGSNGKSTVTSMLGAMAEKANKNVAVGGNLGTPALELLEQDAELYIIELSSFQLERTAVLEATVATVLNVTPDHIDRHGSLAEYSLAKSRVFAGHGVMVLNADDEIVMSMAQAERKTITFGRSEAADFFVASTKNQAYFTHLGKKLMSVKEFPLQGRHNQDNALAALALGGALGLQESAMCAALREFKGLQHRMQRVAEINGVTWINDSKATNIGACAAALRGYPEKVILIAGGDAKGAHMQDLVAVIKSKAKAVILMGKDAGLIAQALHDCVPVYFEETLQQAVVAAAGLAEKGEYVLLSPACASIDQFKNYQERGEKFVDAVKELAA